MLLGLRLIAKVCSILNGEVSPRQIAAGFAAGVWIGLIPVGLLPVVLLFLCFVVNVNLAILFVATAVMKILGFAFDPIANQIGFALLVKAEGLKGLWTQLYNMPLVPYTRFNNTIVLGAFVLGLALLVPLYFLARVGVERYRAKYRERIRNTRFMKALQASTFYRYYVTFRDIRGE
jgi:uncharacterized protein (TIGR03546 family)